LRSRDWSKVVDVEHPAFAKRPVATPNRRPRIPSQNNNVKQRENPIATSMFCHPGRVGERAYTPGETVLSNLFETFLKPAEIRHFCPEIRVRIAASPRGFLPVDSVAASSPDPFAWR